MNLLDEALKKYGMTLQDFAKHIGMPPTTLQTWSTNGKPSKCGEIMLTALIDKKRLEERIAPIEKMFSVLGKELKPFIVD